MVAKLDLPNEEIVQHYKNGKTGPQIAEIFNVEKTTIYHRLEEKGVKRRGKDKCRTDEARNHVPNEGLFEKPLNELEKYWIGFLIADGSVQKYKNKQDMIRITLKRKDKNHLQKFLNFLEVPNQKIYDSSTKNSKRSEISVSSQKLVDKLKHFNIFPNKTFNTSPPKSLANDSHFWRGVIDGDGHISEKRPVLVLCGNKETVKSFKSWVNTFCNTNASVRRAKGNSYRFKLEGNNLYIETLNKIYSNCNIKLDRKFLNYKKLVSENNA